MFCATAASALVAANSTSTATNSFLRSTLASHAVRNGPHTMTTTANSVTSWPAVATVMDRSRASAGSKPTIRNSVVTITNAAMARIVMDSAPPVAWGLSAIGSTVVVDELGIAKNSCNYLTVMI
jgi:hypothetical protein